MCRSFGLLRYALVACLMIGWNFETQAAATITFTQIGNDVQATISGSLNLAALSQTYSSATTTARVRGGDPGANVVIGRLSSGNAYGYSDISGPRLIGCSSTSTDASSASTSGTFGINVGVSQPRVIVPQGYNSLDPISANATWIGASISSLGLSEGTYVYTWGTGAQADNLTIIVPGPGASCAPTLSEWSQMLLGLLVMTLLGWHFHRERSY